MFEKSKNKYIENRKKGEEKGITRRDFLKGIAVGAAALGIKKITEGIGQDENPEDYKLADPIEKGPSEENGYSGLEKEKERDVSQEDEKAIQEILGKFDLKETKFGPEIKNATEAYWYQKYKNDPKMAKSLEYAYLAMQEHLSDLEETFTEQGLSRDFVYLAIPESHWNFEKVSKVGAAGPYQLMKETALKYGLRVENPDERYDILKSASASARIILDIYEKTKDYDLALSGYNGGFLWGYLQEKGAKNCSYAGFLKYIEKKINELKTKLKNDVWKHKVKNGQTFSGIAQRYGVEEKELLTCNKNELKKDKKGQIIVQPGQIIKIPITDTEIKKNIYDRFIGGIIENINYPGKFNAVIRIIRDSRFQQNMKEKMAAEKSGTIMAKKSK